MIFCKILAPNYTIMKKLPSGVRLQTHNTIEVRLWEIYLLRSNINLNYTLSAYALEPPVVERHSRDLKVSFHFMLYDWEKTISHLLTQNSIPYEIVGSYDTDKIRATDKKKVYLAEDDLEILFALNTMLENAGYDVVVSHCGAPMLKANLPSADLFILDNKMPDIDGVGGVPAFKSTAGYQRYSGNYDISSSQRTATCKGRGCR